MHIHLSSLGCRLNEAELEIWASDFRARGHRIVRNPRDADILVLNTCAVTQQAVRKSRKSIQRLHRQNPSARLVVSGCYSTLSSESEHHALGIDLVVNNADKDDLVTQVGRMPGLANMPEAATLPANSALFQRSRQRAFIKIQDGCRYRCTYCIVTVARGEERSRSVAEIVDEVNRLSLDGIQEIALTGVHVGGYGNDLGTDLYTLVKTLLCETDIPRIRFASVEPWDLPDNFFALFSDKRLMPHMHLPLQSGCDSVLRRMARRCKTSDFTLLVDTIRKQLPGFNITTDIIVGFPGETDREWDETMDYIESIQFGHIHIFSFSAREGTKAARLDDHVHGTVKRRRSQALHRLAAQQKRVALQGMLGQRVEVLWESGRELTTDDVRNDAIRYSGYTPNYHRVSTDVERETQLENALVLTELLTLNESGDSVAGLPLELLSQPAPTRSPGFGEPAQSANQKPASPCFSATQRPVIPITQV